VNKTAFDYQHWPVGTKKLPQGLPKDARIVRTTKKKKKKKKKPAEGKYRVQNVKVRLVVR
jgi:hypothetical protein